MDYRKSLRTLAVVSAVAGLSACTSWVDLTPEGEQVTVVGLEHVTTCNRLGKTTSKTTDNLGIVNRTAKTVREEVEYLARNEAAKMGGDTIVPISELQEGRQEFAVYRCR